MRIPKPTAASVYFVAVFTRIVVGEDVSSVPPPSSLDEWEDLRPTGASYYGEDNPFVKERSFVRRRSSPPQRKTTVIGGSRILECPIGYPRGVYADHIITWRKRDAEVPIFVQFNGYPPHVAAGFQDRIRLVGGASIEISDIRRKDQGWYECSVAFLGAAAAGSELEAEGNGTWIHLAVHSLPKLLNVSPSSILLREEAPLNLVCEASGNPFPTVTWSKDGKGVTPSERIRITESSLAIHSTRGQDGGVYACMLRNIVGHVSHTTRVIVAGNVYIIVPPSNTSVFEGGDARFACRADGHPKNISYSWYRGDVPLDRLDVLYQQRFAVFPNGTLVLRDVTKDDSGWYCCRPSNGLGVRPNASAYLNVTFLPRVSEMPVQLLVARGLSARIVCPIEANPPITLVVWSKNERMIDVTKSTTMRVNKQGTLFISTVESTDEGRYSCTPYSPIGAGRSSAPVQIIVKEPPYFTVRPKGLYQREIGQSLSMPCIAHGNPTPTVAWHKVGGELSEERVNLDDGNFTLTDLDENDEGLFECVATSVIGSVVAAVLLIMEVRGSHGAYNVSVATTVSSATVSWLPAYNEGHRHQYVLWYRDLTSDQGDWMTLQVIPEDRYCITVYHLNPGSVYQFMVLARSHLSHDELFSDMVNGSTKGEPLFNREEVTTSLLANSLIVASKEDDHLLPTAGTSILPPTNVTASKLPNGSLLISWQAPNDLGQTVDYYSIQYRTNGRQWVPLSDKIRNNSSSFVWASGPQGLSYHFQVLSHSNGASSRPSRMASFQTEVRSDVPVYVSVSNVLLGVVVGSITFLLLGTVLIVASGYVVRAKKKPVSDAQHSNLKYYNPNTTNKSSSSQESNLLCTRSKDASSEKDPAALLKTCSQELNCSEVRGHHETPI